MDFPLIWAAATEAASSGVTLSTVLNVIWCVFLVLIGVNMLIIVHEFGHFIVARMCGVRCDKFYIWFDIYGWKIFKFKWGDTEYGLGVLPLGGYVKMLGQEDSPGAIKAEIERAKLAAAGAGDEGSGTGDSDANPSPPTPVPSPEQIAQMEQSLYSKDSYLAKSVPQRMAIIVAGVVMNFFFAFLCATGAYMCGVKEESPIVGNTSAGSNAWEAGLLPGDRILSVDGHAVRKFSDIRTSIIRTSKPESDFVIERPGVAEPIELKIAPVKGEKALVATIGITASGITTLAEPATNPWCEKTNETKKLKAGDTLVSVNGEQINSYTELQDLQTKWRNDSLTYVFQRSGSDEPVTVALPPAFMRTLGLQFKAGKIAGVQQHAAQFGFETGDLLVSMDGNAVDPMRLAMQVYDKSQAGGGAVTFVVERNGEQKTLEFNVPAGKSDSHVIPSENSPFACSDILGIAYEVTNEIVSGPENIEPGSTLEKITLLGETPEFLEKFELGKTVKGGFEIPNSDSLPNFVLFLYGALLPRLETGSEIMLTLKTGEKIVEKTVAVTRDQQWAGIDRGLNFDAATFKDKAESFGQAVGMGADATVQNSLLVYYTVEQLLRNVNGTGRVSPKGLGGPVLIVQAAWTYANSGMGKYLLFLCMLSANLAVLNILPIPVLDGGHIVFLTYEAIFRKPPNETVQVILSYMGLLLLLALMVWVFALDLGFIKRF